jgi:hypothetical protein
MIYHRILHVLAQRGVVQRFDPVEPHSNGEIIEFAAENEIKRVVFLGDAANVHQSCHLANKMKLERVYFPSHHLLITDYAQTPKDRSAAERFGHKCWYEVIDYDSYHAPTHNDDVDFYVGFDYGDLFWDAGYIVDCLNRFPGMRPQIPAVLFTDRPRDQVWLPAGIEKCCNVVLWILAIVGVIAAAAGIAYAIYRYLKPCYLEDFDDDFEDDFDDDFFEDEEEDDIPIPVPVQTVAEDDAAEVDAE